MYAQRQLQALDLARRAYAAGARTSTVALLTGLHRKVLCRHFALGARAGAGPGKRPYSSPERFVKIATLATMVDASLAYAMYRDHCERWPQPAEALVTSYEYYAQRRAPCELPFDRVFYLVCWTDRLWAWTGRDAIFRLTTCTRCHCRYLAAPAIIDDHERECPFCKVQVRYWRDPRIQSRFPEREYPQIAAALAGVMTSLRLPADSA